jgi:hypothetical protein
VSIWAEDAQAEVFFFNLSLEDGKIKISLRLTEATDVAAVASIFLTSRNVMQTQLQNISDESNNVKEQYDDFYKFFEKTIDDILYIWNDNDSYDYGRATTSKDKWRFSFTKKDFNDRLFWWKERNNAIHDEAVKEVVQRQNIAQTNAVRRPGLVLTRSIRPKSHL